MCVHVCVCVCHLSLCGTRPLPVLLFCTHVTLSQISCVKSLDVSRGSSHESQVACLNLFVSAQVCCISHLSVLHTRHVSPCSTRHLSVLHTTHLSQVTLSQIGCFKAHDVSQITNLKSRASGHLSVLHTSHSSLCSTSHVRCDERFLLR